MTKSSPNLEEIERDLRSKQQSIRGIAMQRLYLWVKEDPSIHARALALFRQYAADNTQDAWTATSAARGIEHIAGAVESRPVWRDLMARPDAQQVANILLAITDPAMTPELIDLLHHRPETNVRIAVTRILGRLRNTAAFESLVQQLASPALRPHAVEALAELGDPRAIPHLQPLLNDKTDAWPEDNHGPMLRVCDVASAALRRLSGAATPLGQVVAPNAPPRISPTAEPPEQENEAIAAHPISYAHHAVERLNPAAFVPLGLAVFSIAWIGIVVVAQLYRTGDVAAKGQWPTHLLDVICMLPAAIGLLWGIVVLIRGAAHRPIEVICVILGCLGCAVFVFSFGWELTH